MPDESIKYLPIDGNELARFHEAKGVKNHACERCDSIAWAIVNADPGAPAGALPAALDDSKVRVDLFFPLLILSCLVCGNVWLTNRLLYDEWVEQERTRKASKVGRS